MVFVVFLMGTQLSAQLIAHTKWNMLKSNRINVAQPMPSIYIHLLFGKKMSTQAFTLGFPN